MHILAIGCGESGAAWTQQTPEPYDIVVMMNSAVRNGGYFNHYLAIDRHSLWVCPDDLRTGFSRAAVNVIHPGMLEMAEEIADQREAAGEPRPRMLPFYCVDHEHTISKPPGTLYQNINGASVPKLACHGTGLISLLHFYSWQNEVTKITLLGFELELLADGRLHFYDEQPLEADARKMWEQRLEKLRVHVKYAVELASERVVIDIHPECGGALRRILT